MIPRYDDSFNTAPALNGKSSTFMQSDEISEINLKDLTNLKENYSYSKENYSSNMKMDLVIYDGSMPSSYSSKLQANSLNKLSDATNTTAATATDFVQSSDKNYSKLSGSADSAEKENCSIVNQPAAESNHQSQSLPSHQQPKQLGLIGLTNLGNTCYMNSGLQCLFNNKKLIVFFLNEYLKNSQKINLANNSLTSCFVSLMKKVWNKSRDYNVIKPYEFKEIMSQNYSQFQGFRQHDCQEFLTLLLDTLHDQINQGLKLEKGRPVNDEMLASVKEEESPLSNCSNNDLIELSSRTTSPKSSLSTSSTYCDQLSEEEVENGHHPQTSPDDRPKKGELLTDISNQTVVNPIQRLISYSNKSPSSTIKISKDDLKKSLQLVNLSDFSKNTKLSNQNLHPDLNQELAYDSKRFTKTSIDNELIFSTAKQLTSSGCAPIDLNEDYSDSRSTTSSTTSTTASILKKNKRRNNPSCSTASSTVTARNHLNSLSENSNEPASTVDLDLDEENYNSPKRMKTSEAGHLDALNEQQFENLKNEKFSSELEWNKYLTKNKSIIVDTFQGQFKSTVKCSKCLNVSITYEPFMYLPVTLPNALERQIFVTFIPSSNALLSDEFKSARRYLITLNKHDKLERLSNLLREMLLKDQLVTESTELAFAEVEERFIHKILDKSTFLKYVDDKFHDLYAFEIVDLSYAQSSSAINMPNLWNADQTTTVDLISPQLPPEQALLTPTNDQFDYSQNSYINNLPVFNDSDPFFPGSNGGAKTPSYAAGLNNNEIDLTTSHQLNENGIADNFASDYLPLKDNFNSKFIAEYLQADKLGQDVDLLVDDGLKDTFPEVDTSDLKIEPNPPNQFGNDNKSDDLQIVENFGTFNPLPIPLSCAICLEEKDASQLLIHISCSCQLCAYCLDLTVKHCSENETNFLCPTCSLYIDKSDFVPFGGKQKPQPGVFAISYYYIPILFRIDEKQNFNNYKLVIRPMLLRLPSALSGMDLYEIISRFVPCGSQYQLHFVTKTGQKCSRCEWSGTCNGCEIPRACEVFIQPQDSIAVEFISDDPYSPGPESLIPDTLKLILDDQSVHGYRKPEKLTLYQCLKSFNQSEVLDDDNPWFCTVCDSNQKALKSLSIWKAPDTLIVYLKRFVFHNMSSIKVDEPVEFPIEKFDISPYYQVDNKFKDERQNEALVYDLKSIICHSGGVNSGHYTAFSKSAWNNKWYYFNDESVIESEPSSSDERAYILFYETRGGSPLDFLCDETKK